MALFQLYDIDFSWFDVGLNFLFLGYLGKLPGNGHLWFLTVLIACYVALILLLRWRPKSGKTPWVVLIVMELLMVLSEKFGIPGHTFGFVGMFCFVFLRGRWLREKARAMNWHQAAMVLLLNIIVLWLCYNGLHDRCRILRFVLTDICGLSLLLLMLRYVPKVGNRIISWLSGISFEIYIIHHTLCAGPLLKLTSLGYNHVLQFAMIVMISVILAMMLHYIASNISVLLLKKTIISYKCKNE